MKRILTQEEIKDVLSFLDRPIHSIPKETYYSMIKTIRNQFEKQLENKELYPELIPELTERLKNTYYSTLVQPGECVGILTAQSIGERQTQANLNVFHKAGSSDKQPVVSKFSELLNATNKPKAPSYTIYFTHGNRSITELRNTIGHSLVQLSFKKITKSFSICLDKKPEPWYDVFSLVNGSRPNDWTDCISLKLNMDVLFEYKLTLKEIAEFITKEYADMYCIFSPDCFGQLDIYLDTASVDIPEEKVFFVTQENMREVYLEEVVQPVLENMIICGIPGIMNIFFLHDKGEWFVETENSREKVVEKTKFKTTKNKPADSVKRFKQVLAHPAVDPYRTLSNNVWDVYYTLGVEAVRQYMIDQFSHIMDGINLCHVTLLVDRMTYIGSISSISRYTMRSEDSTVCSRISFEETHENLLNAGIYGQQDDIKGVSASIICGKRAQLGSGLCELSMDVGKLLSIEEEENISEEEESDG